MEKELENLLSNYENAIYGKAFPITPSIHQLHLLLDYIANLGVQCKKQKEVIDKITSNIKNDIDGFMTINDHGECNDILDLLNIYLDILKEVINNE